MDMRHHPVQSWINDTGTRWALLGLFLSMSAMTYGLTRAFSVGRIGALMSQDMTGLVVTVGGLVLGGIVAATQAYEARTRRKAVDLEKRRFDIQHGPPRPVMPDSKEAESNGKTSNNGVAKSEDPKQRRVRERKERETP
jgi:hypothetical protein